jgi:MscS family membrane protein
MNTDSLVPVLGTEFTVSLTQLVVVVLLFVLAYALNRGLLRLSSLLYSQSILWIRQLRFWIPIIRIGIWIGFFSTTTIILAPTRQMLFAFIASLGVAVGFAAQELIKNLFGALVIWTDRAFSEGDRVKIGDAEGIVKSIGLRSTKIWAFDDTTIVVPNSMILTTAIYNANDGASEEQCIIELFVPINADMDLVVELGRRAALASDLIEPSKPLSVWVMDDRLGRASWTSVRISAYVRGVAYEKRFMTDVAVRAKRLFREHGIYAEAPLPPVTA